MKERLRRLLRHFGVHLFSGGSLPPGSDWLLDLKKQGLRDNAVFVDVGANVGQTVFEILETLPGAQILSFEPIAETFSTLQKRTRRLPGVRCFPVALGAGCKTIEVCKRENSVLNSLTPTTITEPKNNGSAVEAVAVETLDRVCRMENVTTVDVLKTDTEGYDLEVLKGAESLLQGGMVRFVYTEVTFCEENQQNTPFIPLFEFLMRRNFRFLGLYETYSLHHFPEPNLFCNALFMRR